MILGIVRAREPLIRLTICGFRRRQEEIEAVVDSGYTGWLTLPPTVIAALNPRWRTFGRGILADGSLSSFDVYQAKVIWIGRVRRVFVDEFDATPLVGMALLRGYEYKMQVRGGATSRSNACPGGRGDRSGEGIALQHDFPPYRQGL